ncbi:MAG TPA: isochorismatase family protein [Chthonomonadaceae bacterium]|nr:isochorismatase family protein [Chthonomonadaceae bacterium]
MSAPESHPNLLSAEKTLLVVVDMQEPFLRNIFERERVITNVCALIAGANALRVPVLGTTQYVARMGDVVTEVRRLLPGRQPILDKMTFSCYADPAFAAEVARSDRKQILLCGIETHICVSQTAHELIAAGYQAHVAADAVSSRSEANYRLGLEKLKQGGVLLSSVEMALYEMLRKAGTSEFREILTIIK